MIQFIDVSRFRLDPRRLVTSRAKVVALRPGYRTTMSQYDHEIAKLDLAIADYERTAQMNVSQEGFRDGSV